jgi:hypothetical protein
MSSQLLTSIIQQWISSEFAVHLLAAADTKAMRSSAPIIPVWVRKQLFFFVFNIMQTCCKVFLLRRP